MIKEGQSRNPLWLVEDSENYQVAGGFTGDKTQALADAMLGDFG